MDFFFFFFWRGFNLCKTTCVVIRQRGKFDVKISLLSVVSRQQQMEQSRRTRVLGRAADGMFDASWLELQSGCPGKGGLVLTARLC